jgi:hypothetical protein
MEGVRGGLQDLRRATVVNQKYGRWDAGIDKSACQVMSGVVPSDI